jgi:heptosyltransferase-3
MLVKGTHPIAWDRGGDILLIQLGDIGDVVLNTPSMRALKENFPASRLLVCVRRKAAELLEGVRWCDAVFAVEKKKRSVAAAIGHHRRFFTALRSQRPALAVDLRTGTRGAVIAALSGARVRLGRYAEDGTLWRNRLFSHVVRPDPALERRQYVPEHALNILGPLDLTVSSRRPELSVTGYRMRRVSALLADAGISSGGAPLGFHPFSLWAYKEWSAAGCASLLDHVAGRCGIPVVITGTEAERGRASQLASGCCGNVVNLAGATDIGDLPALYAAFRGLVGVDTAALHIAAAVGTPTLGIFGPSSPVSWAPRGRAHAVVSKALECVPCRRTGCEGTRRSRCMEQLGFAEVQAQLDRWLTEIAPQDA